MGLCLSPAGFETEAFVSARPLWLLPCLVVSSVPFYSLLLLGSFGITQAGIACALEMLTKWISSPRLETRTKESNMHASTGVANPRAQ